MIIRKLELQDADYMLEWMHSNNVTEYLAQNFSVKTVEDCRNFIQSSLNDEDKNIHRAICLDTGEYLGTVSLKHIDTKNRNAEYAISMREKAMGTGASLYGTKEILKFAFQNLGLHKVYLNVCTENKRAIKFYKKFGFVYEGISKEHVLIKGKLRDLEWYAYYEDMGDEK